jgi:hypothetical protein
MSGLDVRLEIEVAGKMGRRRACMVFGEEPATDFADLTD